LISQTQGHESTTVPPRQLRIEDLNPIDMRRSKEPSPAPAVQPPIAPAPSAVPARLGLKAAALAWLSAALAFETHRPGREWRLRLGYGLAWPGPRLLRVGGVTLSSTPTSPPTSRILHHVEPVITFALPTIIISDPPPVSGVSDVAFQHLCPPSSNMCAARQKTSRTPIIRCKLLVGREHSVLKVPVPRQCTSDRPFHTQRAPTLS
jgi:hypothetical protein